MTCGRQQQVQKQLDNMITTWIRHQMYNISSSLNNELPLVSILCYHSIGSNWLHSVSVKDFKQQINELEKRFNFISLSDVSNFLQNKKDFTKPSVALTFDDGYQDVLAITEFLAAKNIKPTMFLLASPEKANTKEMDNELPLLSDNEIQTLIQKGWEIGCHTKTHPNLIALSNTERQTEIIEAKSILEKRIGQPVLYFSYPKGKYTKKDLTMVEKAGYKLAVTMDDSVIMPKSNPFALPRIGINATHSLAEFLNLNTKGSIYWRAFIKNTPLKNFI